VISNDRKLFVLPSTLSSAQWYLWSIHYSFLTGPIVGSLSLLHFSRYIQAKGTIMCIFIHVVVSTFCAGCVVVLKAG
jgi:hypothetical protein